MSLPLSRRAALASLLALAACGPAPPAARNEAEAAVAPGVWPESQVDVFTRFAGTWTPGAGLAASAHHPSPEGGNIPESYEAQLTPDIKLIVFVEAQPPVREVLLVGTRRPSAKVIRRLARAFVAAVSPQLNAGQMDAAGAQLLANIIGMGEGEMQTPNARIGWGPQGQDRQGFMVWAVKRGMRRFSETL